MTKNKILIFILSCLLLVLYFFEFWKLDKNLFTIFDEGYYYLTLLKAKNAEANIGVSQWPYFITSLFSNETLSSIYALRVLRYIFRISTFILFAIITFSYLKKQKSKTNLFTYILFTAAMAFFSIGDMIITYNYIQELFILMSVAFLLLAYSKGKSILMILFGFFSFLTILIIPPSGFLFTFTSLIIIILINFKEKVFLSHSILYSFIGFILSIIFTHFVIVDLRVVYDNIFVGAKDLMSANRGYGPVDHILRLFFYIRDFFIQTCLLIGLYYIASIFGAKTKAYIMWVFFTIGLFVFMIYLKKPVFYISTLWAFPIILFAIEKIRDQNFRFINLLKNDLNKNIINIFLFLLPLISVLGTNTPYAGKMLVFILPWSLLLYQLYDIKTHTVAFKILIPIVLITPLLFSVSTLTNKNTSTQEYFSEGPVHGMKLNTSQAVYFQKVDSLFKVYNFNKNKDYVFATTFDHMTIVAFEAKAINTFQQPEDFLQYKNKENLAKPQFIFMTEYDKTMLTDEFRKLNWGFPDEYVVHFIGTPDPNSIWKSNRWLYCLKTKE